MVVEQMSDAKMVWTVDEYFDRIARRRLSDVMRDEANPRFPRSIRKFKSREQALQFCIHRAERGVIRAKKDLDAAWRRMKRLQKMAVTK
jgi:hypothetical protein